jgi:membrane protease YdiL (CAAX protease family)
VMRARLAAFLLGLGLLFGSLVLGALRVQALLRAELEYEGPWETLAQRAGKEGATRISARLANVALRADEQATFEVCAEGDLATPAFRDALTFVVFRLAEQQLELKVVLDAAHGRLVKRSAGRSCLTLGWGRIRKSGRYALDVVWPRGVLSQALRELPMRARVLGKRPLGLAEGLLVLSAALGAVLVLLSGFGGPERPRDDLSLAVGSTREGGAEPRGREADAGEPRAGAAGLALAFGLLGAALFQLLQRTQLPVVGSGMGRGLLVCALEVALALVGARFAFSNLRLGLRLFAPPLRTALWLPLAAGLALALRALSHYCLSLIPHTGEAPIETYISWPSGALSFALVGMAAPLAEELFFRGFVFGALRRLSLAAAFCGSFALFLLAHVQQVWGNWGALSSLVLTALTLTALRSLSGSTLVPALAHVLFNLSLWSASFRG